MNNCDRCGGPGDLEFREDATGRSAMLCVRCAATLMERRGRVRRVDTRTIHVELPAAVSKVVFPGE